MAELVETPPLTLDQLTGGAVNTGGAFDVLMKATNAHLVKEFEANRLRGADYANVYLNAMPAVLQNAVVFLLQKDEAANKANLVAAQIELTKLQMEMLKIEIEREALNKDLIAAQVLKVKAETANLVSENDNIKAQLCLLQANYDLVMMQKLQTTAQTSLIQQKIATEKAQTVEAGVDDNSVIGKQKLLYKAQTDGFKRDAEQKAAKIWVDTWNVRRTTDDGTVADGTNMLNDVTIGRVLKIMLQGVENPT